MRYQVSLSLLFSWIALVAVACTVVAGELSLIEAVPPVGFVTFAWYAGRRQYPAARYGFLSLIWLWAIANIVRALFLALDGTIVEPPQFGGKYLSLVGEAFWPACHANLALAGICSVPIIYQGWGKLQAESPAFRRMAVVVGIAIVDAGILWQGIKRICG